VTIKQAEQITRESVQFERKAIPDRETSRPEGSILFSGHVRMWHNERPSEVIADPDRMKKSQKAPEDEQGLCQGYKEKQ